MVHFTLLFSLLVACLWIPLTVAIQVGLPSSLVQCQIAQLYWSDATGQVCVTVKNAETRDLLRSFYRQPKQTESLTWAPVNVTAGTRIVIQVQDDSLSVANSPVITVSGSNDSSCLTASPSSSSSSLSFSDPSFTSASISSTSQMVASPTQSSSPPSSNSAISVSPFSRFTYVFWLISMVFLYCSAITYS